MNKEHRGRQATDGVCAAFFGPLSALPTSYGLAYWQGDADLYQDSLIYATGELQKRNFAADEADVDIVVNFGHYVRRDQIPVEIPAFDGEGTGERSNPEVDGVHRNRKTHLQPLIRKLKAKRATGSVDEEVWQWCAQLLK